MYKALLQDQNVHFFSLLKTYIMERKKAKRGTSFAKAAKAEVKSEASFTSKLKAMSKSYTSPRSTLTVLNNDPSNVYDFLNSKDCTITMDPKKKSTSFTSLLSGASGIRIAALAELSKSELAALKEVGSAVRVRLKVSQATFDSALVVFDALKNLKFQHEGETEGEAPAPYGCLEKTDDGLFVECVYYSKAGSAQGLKPFLGVHNVVLRFFMDKYKDTYRVKAWLDDLLDVERVSLVAYNTDERKLVPAPLLDNATRVQHDYRDDDDDDATDIDTIQEDDED